MDTFYMHLGSIVLGLLFSLFGGAMLSAIAYSGCNGAWMARRKTFSRSAVGFFVFYMALHVLMFSWR